MKKRVLFFCTGNSCRSQMAEGLLRHLAGNRFEVFSAGIAPSVVNPYAIKVMAEIGIDISQHRSKSIGEFRGGSFDYVITVCDNARESCPFFPAAKKQLHWGFPDPANADGTPEQILAVYRTVRDSIKEKIISELLIER